MGVSYISLSATCTLLNFISLLWWRPMSLQKLKSDGLVFENFIYLGHDDSDAKLRLGSHATIALMASFALNVYLLLILCLKAIFFAQLYPSERRKLVERLINYVIYKGTFLPLVVSPTKFQAGLWSAWLTVLCTLKMFQALSRDRLERLNASPSVTPWPYFRVYSALLLVIVVDFFWIKLCMVMYKTLGSIFLLLFFEPFSIGFETLQAGVVHGFQLLDIWLNNSEWNLINYNRSKLFDMSAAGSLSEWKGILVRNLGFLLDIFTLLTALGHYVYIWWLHGMASHLVDAVLFLNIRALLSAIVKRVKGFVKLNMALYSLREALPDATFEELHAYDDECAICREPMAKAKRLYCNHLFHLTCLRSWLDQGLSNAPSCPTCRKPLFAARSEGGPHTHAVDVSSDEQLARQLSRQVPSGHAVPVGSPNQSHNSLESSAWRGAGLDSSWLNQWPGQGLDGAGPSTAVRSVGLGRVQMMMRQLTAVGETYAQNALEDAPWSFWRSNSSRASASTSVVPPAVPRYRAGTGGLHVRAASRSASGNLANMLAMAETVREVLPHVPDDVIFQDLQRTNSVTVTVNNLLQRS